MKHQAEMGMVGAIVWMVVLFGIMLFLNASPFKKKSQKRKLQANVK